MPNYCNYSMYVRGDKEDLEDFLKTMQSNYDYDKKEFDHTKHMGGRVFEAEPVFEIEKELGYYGNMYNMTIDGYCAWSVYCCMLEGPQTYYDDIKKLHGDEARTTSLIKESNHLKSIEVFGDEPGMMFQEHYFIQDNQLVADQCKELSYVDLKTQEEVNKLQKENIVSGIYPYDNDDGIEVYQCMYGGFDWNFGNVLHPSIIKDPITRNN